MRILGQFVLPPDVLIVPVAQLDADVRVRLAHSPGDHCVTRPRSRTPSTVVDAHTAALLAHFRQPVTVVDAVIAFSRAERREPARTLDEAMPVLGDFINDGLLVPADSERARPIDTSLRTGERIGGYEVMRPVHLLIDTEVYLARSATGQLVAVKLSRPEAGAQIREAFRHEAAVLDRLNGLVSPLLLAYGERDGNPYLVTSWHAGADAHQAAMDARSLGADGLRERLQLVDRTVDAYAKLHQHGILHGDVHPRNVLVGPTGTVTIIDYGMAATPGWPDLDSPTTRGGIDFFKEPEFATARLAGEPAPPLTAAGEQYSIGALVYFLLTCSHTHEFSLTPDEMLRQLRDQPPLPFAHHGLTDLPAVERSIRRALAQRPDTRHRSVADLRRAIRAALTRDRQSRSVITTPAGRPVAPAEELLNSVLARLAAPGDLFHKGLNPPTASAMNGAAGVAYALLRISRARGDAALLAQADLWSAQAARSAGGPEAYWNAELSLTPELVGEGSLYHHVCGVHAIQALVAHARDDDVAQRLAIDAFIDAGSRPIEHLDVAFGRSGLLLGCALLLELAPLDRRSLRIVRLGDEIRDSIWSTLEPQPPLAKQEPPGTLGAAHGWAGYLFAILRWCEASQTPAPAGFERRLGELAELGEPAGRGMRWPPRPRATSPPQPGLATSWCNGTAGYIPLWILAHRLLHDERYLSLAEMAAWATWEDPTDSGHLCCGLAGRAYALLRLHLRTTDMAWLARARTLAARAAASVRPAPQLLNSLYHGDVGIAVLAAELQTPQIARMPLFDSEGWS